MTLKSKIIFKYILDVHMYVYACYVATYTAANILQTTSAILYIVVGFIYLDVA